MGQANLSAPKSGEETTLIDTGRTYENPRNAARLTVVESWRENDGRRFAFERVLPPGTGKGAPHVHMDYTQTFEALSDGVKLRLDGETRALAAGESVPIRPGTPHVDGWNEGPGEASWRMTIEPVPRFIEVYAETYVDAFTRGALNKQDEFPVLWIFEISRASDGQSWGHGPPIAVQRAIRPLAAWIARRRGYRAIG